MSSLEQQQREHRDLILRLAAEVYTEEGVGVWMSARNAALDEESPETLIERGEAERVEMLIRGLIGGSLWHYCPHGGGVCECPPDYCVVIQ